MSDCQGVRPVLLLEMNEIPWRLVDRFIGDSRLGHIRSFFQSSRTYTTKSLDVGELSPWITWPSLHRGMNNEQHGIRNLGQDPSTFGGTPIWAEYRRRGLSIGICGSLQSWPPIDPGPGGFYIPDTFAHDERCIPSHVEPFQKFNLNQVRKNGRVVATSAVISSDAVRAVLSLPRLGVGLATGAKVLTQFARERVNAAAIARRPIFQTVLFWDVFKSLYLPRQPPAFSTFFTNHVAGIMHRYWHDVFPEDFGQRYAGRRPIHVVTMRYALQLVNSMVADALRWARLNPRLLVVFATSMGQGAVHRDTHEGFEATIYDSGKLALMLGLEPSEYQPRLAMAPQGALQLANDGVTRRVVCILEGCRTNSGATLFRADVVGTSLSITIYTPSSEDVSAGGFRRQDKNGRVIPWEDAGIRMVPVEAGTGYHVPEGILAVHGAGIAPDAARTQIKATDVKALLLQLGGVSMNSVEYSRSASAVLPSGNVRADP